ncbi:MAG TPA: NAD(P)H-hydrate dehydratase, partial [Euzebya sp.]|nr:NAD(P)H-hydrate dehydratase [Euzebya sp.]
MIPLFLPADVQAMDRRAFARGVDPAALMDRAAHHLARGVLDVADRDGLGRYGLRVVLVCGKGNNGGDGIAAARHLAARGVAARVVLVAPPRDLGADGQRELAAWRMARGRVVVADDRAGLVAAVADADVLVDCLLGTGSGGAPRGVYGDAVAAINAAGGGSGPRAAAGRDGDGAQPRALVVACDLPTGLDGADGSVAGQAVQADLTVTLGAHKQGLWLAEGPAHAGRVVLGELDVIDEEARPAAEVLTAPDLPVLIPPIARLADKRARGVVLIWAGSAGMTGAAVLAARGALAAGAGLVTVATHPSAAAVVRASVPEAMTVELPEAADGIRERIDGLLQRTDVVAMGPGLGLAPATQQAVRHLVGTIRLPMVLDADGLNAFRDHRDALAGHASSLLVMTPHAAELARMTGMDAGEVDRGRRAVAAALAGGVGGTVVAKGPGTVIAAADGRVWINATGGPVLATGGTGDVLTGVIAALLAQRPDPATVAAAVHLHGLAGDLAGR